MTNNLYNWKWEYTKEKYTKDLRQFRIYMLKYVKSDITKTSGLLDQVIIHEWSEKYSGDLTTEGFNYIKAFLMLRWAEMELKNYLQE